MIVASFDARHERSAAVSDAYQYDKGQRLRMHGLPSPAELAEQDELLSGEMVAVQVQYSYAGDSQTEARLAVYDEESGTWMAAVPDMYMTRHEDVHVYVYASYGQTEESSRAGTCYEAVFRPISRPAPGDTVTPDQISAWDALVQEINLSLATVSTATSGANAAAASASEAAQRTETTIAEARQMTQKWENATAAASTLAPGSAATVTLSERNGVKHLAYGIPKGEKGAKGDTGATGPQGPKGDTGPAGVTFRLSGSKLYITTDY